MRNNIRFFVPILTSTSPLLRYSYNPTTRRHKTWAPYSALTWIGTGAYNQ
jgi:hypothetical protein